jgi:uncharacterized LabA/DUF88 family protein
MRTEPAEKRAVVFIDGQNLFYAVKEAFGHRYPNYDADMLARAICAQQKWSCRGVCFYTGVPEEADNSFWHAFWNAKLAAMGSRGVHVFRRALRYRNQTVRLPDGNTHTFLVAQEKGIDIRLALDVVHTVRTNQCDVAVVLSQDQDLSEVADEVRFIAQEQERWVKMVSAFPFSPTSSNRRGVNKTDWIRISRELYDSCIDHNDYRPKSK